MPKWSWIIILAIVIVAGYYLAPGGENNPSGGIELETATLERGDIVRSVATSGAVRPLITVEVGSQLSGQVAEIFADFNTQVEEGQVIAQIDTKTFETRVLQSEADLSVAESNVIVQRASIDRARANLRKAQLEFERAEPLRDKGTLSVSAYDTALAAFESAKAELTMAEAQLQNALASRQQREASLESARIDLDRTNIRSPIDGVVIERAVDQGQTVAASLSSPTLFRIAQDLSEIQIEANVDEADIGNVREGNPVSFTVDAFPDQTFEGEVAQVRLSPVEQNNVVTYTVIITAANPERKLLPGMTAIVEIVTGTRTDALRVPNEALRFRPPAGSKWSESSAGQAAASGQAQGGAGGRMTQEMSRLAEELGLDESQVASIREDVRRVMDEMRPLLRAGGGADADGAAVRDQMRQRISDVYRSHLTAAQFQAYQSQRAARQEMRPGTLWVREAGGEIREVNVRLGISDDRYTLVSGRGIEEGTEVVTRMRTPRS